MESESVGCAHLGRTLHKSASRPYPSMNRHQKEGIKARQPREPRADPGNRAVCPTPDCSLARTLYSLDDNGHGFPFIPRSSAIMFLRLITWCLDHRRDSGSSVRAITHVLSLDTTAPAESAADYSSPLTFPRTNPPPNRIWRPVPHRFSVSISIPW